MEQSDLRSKQAQERLETVLVTALVAWATQNAESAAECEELARAFNPPLVKRFNNALKNEQAMQEAMGTIPKDAVRVPKSEDRLLLMRALAALRIRNETTDARKQRIEQLAIEVGIDLDRLDEASEELKIPDSPEGDLEWRSADGRKIKLKEMENTHLLNTIRFMERSAKSDQGGELLIMHALANYKPSATVSRAIKKAQEGTKPEAPPFYWAMRREAERRGFVLAAPEAADEVIAKKAPKLVVPTPGARVFSFED